MVQGPTDGQVKSPRSGPLNPSWVVGEDGDPPVQGYGHMPD